MLELRATHDGRFGDPSHRPRMHLGEGITGTSAAEGRPVMIAEAAHLDARFVGFPNLPEDEYESILAVPVLARDRLEGALNVRTRLPRAFGDDEVALLTAIAGQVGQAIENAKLYEQTRAAGVGAGVAGRPGDPPPGQEQPADGGLAAAPAGRARSTIRRPSGRSRRASTGSCRSRPCTTC